MGQKQWLAKHDIEEECILPVTSMVFGLHTYHSTSIVLPRIYDSHEVLEETDYVQICIFFRD